MTISAGIYVGRFSEERGSDDCRVDETVEILEGKGGDGSGGNVDASANQHDVLHKREQFL